MSTLCIDAIFLLTFRNVLKITIGDYATINNYLEGRPDTHYTELNKFLKVYAFSRFRVAYDFERSGVNKSDFFKKSFMNNSYLESIHHPPKQ